MDVKKQKNWCKSVLLSNPCHRLSISAVPPGGAEPLLRDGTGVYEIVTRKVPDPLDPGGNGTVDEPVLKNGRVFYKQISHLQGTVGYDNYLYYRTAGKRYKDNSKF